MIFFVVWFLVKYVLVTSCHATLRLNTPDVTALPEYSIEVEGKQKTPTDAQLFALQNCKTDLKKYIYLYCSTKIRILYFTNKCTLIK